MCLGNCMPETRIDTHAPIVQASCARLILLLMDRYPGIEKLSTQPLTDDLSQGSLIAYLDHLINKLIDSSKEEDTVEIKAVHEDPRIEATVVMADSINALPQERLSKEDKQRVFKQMQFIARSYPGGEWDAAREQWSINSFYNPHTRADEKLMTTPATALNLVCKALLDETYYQSINPKDAAENRQNRISNFYSHLLELRKEVESGELQKCSAGLQHDLLNLLNRAYLGNDGEPINFLMDHHAFLQESLVLFIDKQLKIHPGPETNEMLLAWMRWKAMSSHEPCPLIFWLRNQFPSSLKQFPDNVWKTACKAYLTKQCEEFFVNPERSDLDAYVEQIADSATPTSQDSITPLIDDLMRTGNLVPPLNQASPMALLITMRNQALAQFKMEVVSQPNQVSQIEEFFKVLDTVFSLYHYRDLTLFISREEDDFNLARENLIGFLNHYLEHYSLNKKMTSSEMEAFENLNMRYRNLERIFLQQNDVHFISLFFDIVWVQGFHNAWVRLHALKPEGAESHPLLLSDEVLRQWQAESIEVADGGQAVFNVTPYMTNRLLLHAMIQHVGNWTVLSCHDLIILTEWLAHSSLEDEENLREFKLNYPPHLLRNLLFMAQIKLSTLADDLKGQIIGLWPEQKIVLTDRSLFLDVMRLQQLTNQQRTQIINALEGRLNTLIQDVYHLRFLFSLSPTELDMEQRIRVWDAIEGPLRETLVQSGAELFSLFSLTLEQFNVEQRTQAFNELEQRPLRLLIQDGLQLWNLFSLSLEQLNEAQREKIWIETEERLSTVVQTRDQFLRLFALSSKQLNEAQREQIVHALEGRLETLIQTFYNFISLFSLSSEQLNEAQRSMILNEGVEAFRTFGLSSFDLYELFSLSKEQLNEEQRNQILDGLEERQLESAVNSLSSFYQLFSLSLEQLSSTQRTRFLDIVGEKIESWIKTSDDLSLLCSLSKEQLNQELRSKIWHALEGRLDTFFERYTDLITLFIQSEEELNEAQRTQILYAVEKKFKTLMEYDYSLKELFSLFPEELNEAQRTLILDMLLGQLGTLIQDLYHFRELFLLSLEQLNIKQREQIFNEVGGQLGGWIKSVLDLRYLFWLSPEKLNGKQRDYIWHSVEPRLSSLIQNMNHLMMLYSLSEEQLNPKQRQQIWHLVEDRLGTFIRSSGDVRQLFSLSEGQLNQMQRTQIWNVIEGRLESLAQSAEELEELLSLKPDQPYQEQSKEKPTPVSGFFNVNSVKDSSESECNSLSRINSPRKSPRP